MRERERERKRERENVRYRRKNGICELISNSRGIRVSTSANALGRGVNPSFSLQLFANRRADSVL